MFIDWCGSRDLKQFVFLIKFEKLRLLWLLMLNNYNINIYERRAIYIEYPGYSTGCPTKHDSWWIVFSVCYTVLVISDFLQFISLNNLYSNIYLFENNFTIILLPFSISSSLVSNYLKLWKKTFLCIYQMSCFVGHPVYTKQLKQHEPEIF